MGFAKIKSVGLVRKLLPYIPQSLREGMRYVNARCEFKYSQYKQVKDALAKRDPGVEVRNDIDFLNRLHQIFPIPERGKYSYEDYMSHVKTASLFLDFVRRYTPLIGKHLLDVGTGYGGPLVLRENYGLKSTTGVDGYCTKQRFEELCSTMQVRASKELRYLTGDFLDVDFGERQFDIIMSLNCFEHFKDPEAVFKKCLTLLRRGGYMFFSFGPLFRAPYGAHRFRYTGVPYLQNMFSDALVYYYFKNELHVLDEFQDHNNYAQVERTGNPFAEMNRWRVRQFENLFTQNDQTRIVMFVKIKDYQFWWYRKLASKYMKNCSTEDITIDSILIIFQKDLD